MIDIAAIVREKLVANAPLVAVTGERIYAAARLPASYKPVAGGAVLFSVEGGTADYGPTLRPTLKFQCYGLTDAVAWQVDRLVFDALHDLQSGIVLKVQIDVLGQIVAEQQTDWRYVLSYYRAQIANI